MRPSQPMWMPLAVVAFVAVGTAGAVETLVTFDVTTPDPNDANNTAPLIPAVPSQPITYSITAIVYTDPNDQTSDPNITNGLGAAYVTLNTNFGDANLVGGPNAINANFTVYPSTGLAFGDDITDIGGSQDLLGESGSPVELANGQRVVLAEGTVIAPSTDGVYHVWVTAGGTPALHVSVLEPNLSSPPFGRAPDQVSTGQGFYVVVGTYNYYTLTLGVVNGEFGDVEVTPNLPSYPTGMEVTLTAWPDEGKAFQEWRHYDTNDPNYLNDPNDSRYFTVDVNNPTTVVMNQDRTIGAVFACGSGLMATLTAFGVLGVVRFVRRRR